MKVPFFRQIAWYLIGAMFLIGIVPKVEAGFSPSQMTAPGFDRTADLEKVRQVIETKMVRDRLEKLGFTSDEISSRLGQLSDGQMHELARNLDDIKVGGNGLGIVITLLVIAILVVLLIYLTGHTVVVK
jgi:hypothetical protein